jgi:hypothetical protein
MKRWLSVAVVSASIVLLAGVALTTELHRPPTVYSVITWETSRPHPKSETVFEGKGSEHCGWEDLTFLSWNSRSFVRSFVRDVNGELAAYTVVPFEAHATPPAGATFTGWYDGQRQLWNDPDVLASIYVVSPDGVERWPAIGLCF